MHACTHLKKYVNQFPAPPKLPRSFLVQVQKVSIYLQHQATPILPRSSMLYAHGSSDHAAAAADVNIHDVDYD